MRQRWVLGRRRWLLDAKRGRGGASTSVFMRLGCLARTTRHEDVAMSDFHGAVENPGRLRREEEERNDADTWGPGGSDIGCRADQLVGERRDAVLGRPAGPWEKKARAAGKMRESGAGLRKRKGPGWTAGSRNSRAGHRMPGREKKNKEFLFHFLFYFVLKANSNMIKVKFKWGFKYTFQLK